MKRHPVFHRLPLLAAAFCLTFLMPEKSGGVSSETTGETPPPARLYQLSPAEVDKVMASVSRTCRSAAERIAAYSELALGTPYVRDSLGEGSGGSCDKDPLMDLSRVDCVTFCEQILALAISSGYGQALHNLQKIRYRDGIIHFASRNHFVMADWLPNNQWLLRNITEEVGASPCLEMTKVIDRRQFAASRGCPDVSPGTEPRFVTIRYIPSRHLLTTAARLQGSEILVLITTRESMFASHLGFIIKDKTGGMSFRHASLIRKKVIDESLEQLQQRVLSDPQTAGFALIAIREEAVTPFPAPPDRPQQTAPGVLQ